MGQRVNLQEKYDYPDPEDAPNVSFLGRTKPEGFTSIRDLTACTNRVTCQRSENVQLCRYTVK